MVDNNKILAIIPARGSSKRLVRKNIRFLNGHPLIAYTIDAAKKCPLIDRIIVSTEDDEIASVVNKLSVEVQKRPAFLSQDDVGNNQVILYVLEKLAESNEHYDTLVLLQPTSPLRIANDITQCLYRYIQSEQPYQSAMSVCLVEHHPAKAVTIDNNMLKPYVDTPSMEERSQLLPKVYRQNGAIYIVNINLFKSSKRLYHSPCLPYIMDTQHSVDIDTLFDLKLAELLLLEEEMINDSSCRI